MTARNVFITGIHTGLGHALTAACLDAGHHVYAVSRQAPADLEARPELRFTALDLRDFAAIDEALATLLAPVGELHLALLNAGILGELKDLRHTGLDELREVMDVNVWANKVVVDALLANVKTVRQIVAISSGAAFNGSGGWGAYSISKSALNLLMRVYAHEHRSTHFTALAPGVVYTPMIDTVLGSPDDPRFDANQRIRQAHDEARIVSATDAAAKILARTDELLVRQSGSYVDIRKM